MVRYDVVKNWVFEDVRHEYAERDTMLYALGIGLGSDPTDVRQLQYVYEQSLRAFPTMATVVGAPGLWWRDSRTGAEAFKVVQGEQHLRLLHSLPSHGVLLARNRVQSLTDKGDGKGAIAVVSRDVLDAATGDLLAQGTNVSFLRGDGGFSSADGISDAAPVALPKVPATPADWTIVLTSVPQAALIYRLSGDYNPIHADPAIALRVGFERPILHGLCSFGMACHAVLRARLDYDAARLRALAVRFTAPVYPGEALRFELWRGADDRRLHLRASADARGVVVLDNGTAEID